MLPVTTFSPIGLPLISSPVSLSSQDAAAQYTRRAAFLFLQDLFDLKDKSQFIPLKDKYRCYTVRELIITYLIKAIELQSQEKKSQLLSVLIELFNPDFSRERLSRAVANLNFCPTKATKYQLLEKMCFSSPTEQSLNDNLRLKKILKVARGLEGDMERCMGYIREFKTLTSKRLEGLKAELAEDSLEISKSVKKGRGQMVTYQRPKFQFNNYNGQDFQKMIARIGLIERKLQKPLQQIVTCLNAMQAFDKLSPESQVKLLNQFAEYIGHFLHDLQEHFGYLETQKPMKEIDESALSEIQGLDTLQIPIFEMIKTALLKQASAEMLGESLTEKKGMFCEKKIPIAYFSEVNRKLKEGLSIWCQSKQLLTYMSEYFTSRAKGIVVPTIAVLEEFLLPTETKKPKHHFKRKNKPPVNYESSSDEEGGKVKQKENRAPNSETTSVVLCKKQEKEPLVLLKEKLTQIGEKPNTSYPLLSELASCLSVCIKQNPRFSQEELKGLSEDCRVSCQAATSDASFHLMLSAAGFEIWARAINNNGWQSLGAILPMLVLDWHGVSEQARRMHHIVQKGKPSESHHLVELNKSLLPGTFEQADAYLEGLDDGQIWMRYPHTNNKSRKAHNLPAALTWMQFAQKFSRNIAKKSPQAISQDDINNLSRMIDYVCDAQSRVWAEAMQLVTPSQENKTLIQSYQAMINHHREQLKASLSSLIGKKYSTLTLKPQEHKSISELILQVKHAKQEAKKQKVKALNSDRPEFQLGDIKRHLQGIAELIPLRERISDTHLEAWLDRNLLNLQWALESAYRFRAGQMGYTGVDSHRFYTFQALLSSAGIEISEEERKGAEPFDLGKKTYYPWWTSKVQGKSSPLVKNLVNKVLQTQKRILDAAHYSWGETSKNVKGGQKLSEEFQRGIRALQYQFRF